VRSSFRCAKTLVFIGLLVGLAPASSQAENTWRLPPEQLAATLQTPQSYQYQSPAVVAGPGGAATALIARSGSPALLSLDRVPGGGWSELPVPSGSAPVNTALAGGAGSAGTQTAVWLENGICGCELTAFASRRKVGESWQPAVELPRFGSSEDSIESAPALAEDAAGDAVVVWSEIDSSFSSERLVATEWRDGSWGAPQRIAGPTQFIWLSDEGIASDGPDEFVVGWSDEPSPGVYEHKAETLNSGGWTGEQAVESSPDFSYGAAVSGNASGQASMVWADQTTETVHAASLRSGAWTVSNPAGTHIHAVCNNAAPQIGVDNAGRSLALWMESDGRLTSETMASGGAWLGDRTAVATLNPESRSEMRMAVDGEGAALAGWTSTALEPPYLAGAGGSTKAAGGSWASPVTFLSGTAGFGSAPTAAIAADGSGVASWIDSVPIPETNEAEWEETPYAAVVTPPAAQMPGVVSSGSNLSAPPNPPEAASAARRLGPVYLQVQHHRLWLSRQGRTVTAAIRNTNPFAVGGTARIYEYLAPRGKRGHDSALAVAALVHYHLAAHQTRPVRFRIARRALRRLHALVPDRGHILVTLRLSIEGEGQSAQSSVLMALDQAIAPHRGRLRRPRVPAGYPAPVDPWARKAC